MSTVILIGALSGKGKTFFSAQGGKPFYLAPETKCQGTVKVINPDALVFPIDTKADFEKAIKAVQDPRLVEKGYTRIVLDSYSELTEIMPEMMGMGFPLQIQDYGTIGNKAMELVRAMLKSPIPGIIISRSEAKEQGKVHRVVPGSLGKSAGNLPAKCVLTAETRCDEQLGWVVDTTPDDYTQRAGLPWVPHIFQGTADEFLALVEAGPAVEAPTTTERIAAAGKAADAMETARRAGIAKPAKTIGEIAVNMAKAMAAVPEAPMTPEVALIMDGMEPLPKTPTVPMATEDQCKELYDLAKTHKVDTAQLLAYAVSKGWAPGQNWLGITTEGHQTLTAFLTNDSKRRGLQAHLVQHFGNVAA